MAAPDGSSRRPAPRPTTDDGTLTRERHRLACGSPSRAPGRRPGGVTLRFSDRCPVHDGDGDLRFRAAPWWSTRFPAWRRPTGRADRPGPRSTADDGTLTRERHRLACGSPSRAPGRRPGGVTLGFSDRCPVSGARRRRRHPVPYRPWWSTRSPAWRAPAWTGQLTRWWADTFPPMLSRHRARAGRVTRNWPVPGWKRSTIFLRTVGNIPQLATPQSAPADPTRLRHSEWPSTRQPPTGDDYACRTPAPPRRTSQQWSLPDPGPASHGQHGRNPQR